APRLPRGGRKRSRLALANRTTSTTSATTTRASAIRPGATPRSNAPFAMIAASAQHAPAATTRSTAPSLDPIRAMVRASRVGINTGVPAPRRPPATLAEHTEGSHGMTLSNEAEYVLRTVEERGIKFVRLWFTDVLGTLKSFAITPQELEGAFTEG